MKIYFRSYIYSLILTEGKKRKISEGEQLSEQENKRASPMRDEGSQAGFQGENTGGAVGQGGHSDGSRRSVPYSQRHPGDRREVYDSKAITIYLKKC